MQKVVKPDNSSTTTVVQRLAEVRTRIARSVRDCDRDPRDVTLVCVSKTFDAEAIVPVLAAGRARVRREPGAGGAGQVAGAA